MTWGSLDRFRIESEGAFSRESMTFPDRRTANGQLTNPFFSDPGSDYGARLDPGRANWLATVSPLARKGFTKHPPCTSGASHVYCCSIVCTGLRLASLWKALCTSFKRDGKIEAQVV